MRRRFKKVLQEVLKNGNHLDLSSVLMTFSKRPLTRKPTDLLLLWMFNCSCYWENDPLFHWWWMLGWLGNISRENVNTSVELCRRTELLLSPWELNFIQCCSSSINPIRTERGPMPRICVYPCEYTYERVENNLTFPNCRKLWSLSKIPEFHKGGGGLTNWVRA